MSKKVERKTVCGRVVVFEVGDHDVIPDGVVEFINDCSTSVIGPSVLITMGLVQIIGKSMFGAANIFITATSADKLRA